MTVFSIRVPRLTRAKATDVDMGDPVGSSGALTLTDRFVECDGAPWFPVMGEYHFSRDDAAGWERELLKMKAGGINVVATYVLWILHEERAGDVRWDGNRDLRRFIELAGSLGLAVLLRIGPWAHGETRNGGFPDWVQSMPVHHRTNDPEYLQLVRAWYTKIAEQVTGLIHSPTNPEAPIIGLQVDNELYDQPEHLDSLRGIAEEVGMHASLWVATGWGGAQLPVDRLMPVYAGYSDGFWEASTTDWPEFGRMHFIFNTERDDLSVGADLRATKAVAAERDHRYPFVTCELGGGMHVAYHRRPLVDSADVSALALTKLGSGSAWQGYYLYHGVTQQVGQLSTTQESHETDYPNDLPLLDYDFFAPIGAHGQLREHYHLLRQQHLFLHQYGAALATYPSVIPPAAERAPRWAVRGDDNGGYLFVNNHQPAADPLPAIADVQFSIEFDSGAVTVPNAPITIPAGSHFVWPLRRKCGDVPQLSGTVQPITEIQTESGILAVFAAIDGIEAEFRFEGIAANEISGADVCADDLGGLRVRPHNPAGVGCIVTVGTTRLLILDPESAKSAWRGQIGGVDSLVMWHEGATFKDDLTLYTSCLTSDLLVFPPISPTCLPASVREDGELGPFRKYVVAGPEQAPKPRIELLSQAGSNVPMRTGGPAERLSAPTREDFENAADIRIFLADTAFDDSDQQLLLELDWVGDVGQAWIDGDFVSDQFWSGRHWDIDLTPYRHRLGGGVEVRAFPWNPDSGVFVDPRVKPGRGKSVLEIRGVTLKCTREIVIGRHRSQQLHQ